MSWWRCRNIRRITIAMRIDMLICALYSLVESMRKKWILELFVQRNSSFSFCEAQMKIFMSEKLNVFLIIIIMSALTRYHEYFWIFRKHKSKVKQIFGDGNSKKKIRIICILLIDFHFRYFYALLAGISIWRDIKLNEIQMVSGGYIYKKIMKQEKQFKQLNVPHYCRSVSAI